MPKRYSPRQRAGSEFGGNVQPENQIQPRQGWNDLSAAEKRQMIVRTGQEGNVEEPARTRNFLGQSGDKPRDPAPPRYTS